MNRGASGWGVLAIGVLLMLSGGALLYQGLRQPAEKPAILVACPDIVAGCALPDRPGRIAFDRRPQTLKPFRIQVDISGARVVHASLAMRDMQMGANRYRLLADGERRWKADILLPICTNDRSDWIMTLEIDGKRYQLSFTSY